MSMSSLLAVMPFLGHKDASEAMKDPSRMGGSTRRGHRHPMSDGSRPTRDMLGVSSMGISRRRQHRQGDSSVRSYSSRTSMRDGSLSNHPLHRSKTSGTTTSKSKPKSSRRRASVHDAVPTQNEEPPKPKSSRRRASMHGAAPTLQEEPPMLRTMSLATGTQHKK